MNKLLYANLHAQYLKTMGIQVWVRRNIPPTLTEEPSPVNSDTAQISSPPAEKNPEPELDDWDSLQNKVATCMACELHQTRTKTVFGVGNRQADLMLIGEAPNADEDAQGEPFVGQVGQLFNDMLYAIDLKKESVYVTNVVKCSPPENRKPNVHDLACCNTFLQRQIALVQPKLIVALGNVAAHHLLANDTAIGKLRGESFKYGDAKIPLIATYHPAYLLRRPSEKRHTWQDLQSICQTMADLKT